VELAQWLDAQAAAWRVKYGKVSPQPANARQ
jgi:hypothetical protein